LSTGKVVPKSRETAVADTTALQTPGAVRVVDDQPVFVSPEPSMNTLRVQQVSQSFLQVGALIVELGERLVMREEY
jgi:hypothetical protein